MTVCTTRITRPVFVECSCCEHFHPVAFDGDCRDDENRFSPWELDRRYGSEGWELRSSLKGGVR